jgi:glutathione S-transferase
MAPRPVDRDTFFRLYAAEESYYSAKVRPALRYKRVPFVELLPTVTVQREVLRGRTGLGQVPVVVTPEDETWQDSSDILDRLEARFPDPALFPRTPVQRLAAYLIECYADEFLILPGLHFRWSFPEGERKARAEFAVLMGDADASGRFADAVMAYTRMVGVLPETTAAIEAHTRELLEDLSAHFRTQPFLLGGRPSLADMGLIGPFYPHLYLDAVPGRLLRETAPEVCRWIARLNHPDPDDPGDWLPDDALAPTLRPVLERIGRDAVPYVLDIARAFDAWAAANAGHEGFLPRVVGMHPTRLRGVAFERVTTPYTQWMVERVGDAYRALGPTERVAVDRAFAGTGCEALLAHVPRHRVERRPFRLALARG